MSTWMLPSMSSQQDGNINFQLILMSSLGYACFVKNCCCSVSLKDVDSLVSGNDEILVKLTPSIFEPSWLFLIFVCIYTLIRCFKDNHLIICRALHMERISPFTTHPGQSLNSLDSQQWHLYYDWEPGYSVPQSSLGFQPRQNEEMANRDSSQGFFPQNIPRNPQALIEELKERNNALELKCARQELEMADQIRKYSNELKEKDEEIFKLRIADRSRENDLQTNKNGQQSLKHRNSDLQQQIEEKTNDLRDVKRQLRGYKQAQRERINLLRGQQDVVADELEKKLDQREQIYFLKAQSEKEGSRWREQLVQMSESMEEIKVQLQEQSNQIKRMEQGHKEKFCKIDRNIHQILMLSRRDFSQKERNIEEEGQNIEQVVEKKVDKLSVMMTDTFLQIGSIRKGIKRGEINFNQLSAAIMSLFEKLDDRRRQLVLQQ